MSVNDRKAVDITEAFVCTLHKYMNKVWCWKPLPLLKSQHMCWHHRIFYKLNYVIFIWTMELSMYLRYYNLTDTLFLTGRYESDMCSQFKYDIILIYYDLVLIVYCITSAKLQVYWLTDNRTFQQKYNARCCFLLYIVL